MFSIKGPYPISPSQKESRFVTPLLVIVAPDNPSTWYLDWLLLLSTEPLITEITTSPELENTSFPFQIALHLGLSISPPNPGVYLWSKNSNPIIVLKSGLNAKYPFIVPHKP